jgi:hypothetical protein
MTIETIGKPAGCKLIRITCSVEEPVSDSSPIGSILIRGDFFAIPEESFEKLETLLAGTELGKLGSKFDDLSRELGIRMIGINGAGIEELARKAFNVA